MIHFDAVESMLHGFIIAEQLLVAVLFFRYWRKSGTPLFAFLTAGFTLMAVHRFLLGGASHALLELEQQTMIFIVRLLSYGTIFAGLVLHNSRRRGRAAA